MNKSRIYIDLFSYWVLVFEIICWIWLILVGRIWDLDTVKISFIKGMFFLMYRDTTCLFFVLYCGCIYLWLVVPDCGSDSYFCSCRIGRGSCLFFVSVLVPFCGCIYYTTVAAIYSICCHNKLVLWLRSFDYFANGLLYRLGLYPVLQLCSLIMWFV